MVRLFRSGAALLGWFALGLQYWLMMTGRTGPDPLHRTINFFSYFTILTNILAGFAMTLPVVAPRSSPGAFFNRPTVRTAIVTYIIVVAVTYHLLLRQLANLQGWDKIADTALHYVLPLLFVLDWLLVVPKRSIPWKNVLTALIVPLLYIIWTLIHGTNTGFYPYPFLDVAKLGLEKVLINAAGMAAGFAGLGVLLTAIGRVSGPRTAAA